MWPTCPITMTLSSRAIFWARTGARRLSLRNSRLYSGPTGLPRRDRGVRTFLLFNKIIISRRWRAHIWKCCSCHNFQVYSCAFQRYSRLSQLGTIVRLSRHSPTPIAHLEFTKLLAKLHWCAQHYATDAATKYFVLYMITSTRMPTLFFRTQFG